jgi:DNA-binding MarR family transcriptional regulator
MDKDESADSLDQSRLSQLLGFRLSHAELQVRRMFLESMRSLDLKPVDYSVLVLVDANTAINQRQLAEVLDVSAPNLAIVIARLVKRRLLRQVRGNHDRRMQHLYLTATGKTQLLEAETTVQQMEARLMQTLGTTGVRNLLRALDQLSGLGSD